DRLPEQLFTRVAEETLDLAVDEDDFAAAVDHHHAVRGRLHGGTEAGLGALAGADVHDRCEDELAFLRFNRVETDLDGDLAAVPPHAEQIPARAHGAALRVREE